MAGMKYSPGFEDPSARPRTARSRGIVVAAALLGIAALGATFAANPRMAMAHNNLGSVLAMCAQVIGLR